MTKETLYWLVPLLVAVALFALPRLQTSAMTAIKDRVLKLEGTCTEKFKELGEGKWALTERLALEARLVRMETTLNLVHASLKEFGEDLEKAAALSAHSPHTPELDGLLDKISTGQKLNDIDVKRAVHLLSELIENPETTASRRAAYANLRGVMVANYKLRQKERELYVALNVTT